MTRPWVKSNPGSCKEALLVCTKYRERTENFKGLIKSPSHKFREAAVAVESNNTDFLISLFENFLKDILKSAPYLFGTLIRSGSHYGQLFEMSLIFKDMFDSKDV